MIGYFSKDKENESDWDGVKCNIRTRCGGLHWVFTKGDKKLSVILHEGSYGGEAGLFEIMPWEAPESWGDRVKGCCTFGEVQEWINKLREVKP